MSIGKKIAVIFLAVLNAVNIAAGAIAQTKIITGSDVVSILPIKAQLSVIQILLVNFMAVVLVIMLISIVTAILSLDVPYSPLEILSNCPIIFLLLPILISFVGVFNAIKAPDMSDKLSIIASGLIYVLASAVNIGCIITIRED